MTSRAGRPFNNRYDHLYVKADKSFLVNDDPDLQPIRISLPEPPKLSLIDGYGLPPSEQYFKRVKEPERLTNLIQHIKDEFNQKARDNTQFRVSGFKIQQEIWRRLNASADRYVNEIQWIKQQWWHKLHGYWFFNNSKPTYICGWHYAYLNYWYSPSIKGGYPEYRDRDRRWFLFNKYIYDCTETFEELDAKGIPVRGADGKFHMKDVGKRIFLGAMNNKHRRAGDTSKSVCVEHEILMLNPGTYGGNISYSSRQIEDTFHLLIVPAWREYPYYLKPFYNNNNKPAEEIRYDVPANEFEDKGINSVINYSSTGEAKMYDGKKVSAILVDEAGKTPMDVGERHSVLKLCLTNGADIIGYCMYPSTVEEIEGEGGESFKKMSDQSMFYQRIPETGSTITGLVLHFYPAYDCYEGFVDKYGQGVIDEPTKEQKEQGFKKGAKQLLQGELDFLLRRGDPESINRYRELKRKKPMRYSDSWLGSYGGIGFDILKIDQRLAELDANRSLSPRRGDLVGSLTDPEWQDSDDGRFFCSMVLPKAETCRKIRKTEIDPVTNEVRLVWYPAGKVRFTAGGDSFNYLNESERRMQPDKSGTSKGGGTLFLNRDKTKDPDTKPIEQWETYRFVMTYLYRPPTDDEFVKDMIRMCVWAGAYMYPETNKETLWKEFIQYGFGGYLAYDIDSFTGRRKDRPGIYLQNQKEDLFKLFQQYIYHRCHIEVHDELLRDAKDITSVKALTNFDRLAAAMEALWGSQTRYNEVMSQSSNVMDLTSLARGIL